MSSAKGSNDDMAPWSAPRGRRIPFIIVPSVAGGSGWGTARQVGCAPSPALRLAQGPKRRPDLLREQFRFLPGREVAALVDLVEVDEVVVGLLGPAARRAVDLAREDGDGRGGRDVHGVEVVGVVLPVEAGSGRSRVG